MATSKSFGAKLNALLFGATEKPPRKFTIDRYVIANAHVSEEKRQFLTKLNGRVFFGDELNHLLFNNRFDTDEIRDVHHFAEKYVARAMDTPGQILWIPRAIFWVFLLHATFQWGLQAIYTGKLVDVINNELQPEHPVTLFQVSLGLAFMVSGFATFIWATIGYPIQQAWVCHVNEYVKNTAKFKEKFFSPIPRKIMSLGVVPMILAILGIIFFKEDQLLDVLGYFTLGTEQRLGLDPLKLLLLCGGLCECAAFFLGYLFPEESPESHVNAPATEEAKAQAAASAATGGFKLPVSDQPVTVINDRNVLTDEQLKRMLSSVRVSLKLDV